MKMETLARLENQSFNIPKAGGPLLRLVGLSFPSPITRFAFPRRQNPAHHPPTADKARLNRALLKKSP
jgi:hypothetical protein